MYINIGPKVDHSYIIFYVRSKYCIEHYFPLEDPAG